MTIIELLNKIANGEEVPKKIKWHYRNFEYNEFSEDYLCVDKNDERLQDYCNGVSICKWLFASELNDTVEIIEEEKKIEKLKSYRIAGNKAPKTFQETINLNSGLFFNKINELINEINKLKEDKYGK